MCSRCAQMSVQRLGEHGRRKHRRLTLRANAWQGGDEVPDATDSVLLCVVGDRVLLGSDCAQP